MDETEQPVSEAKTDGEGVANTMDAGVANRRRRRKILLAQIANFQKEVADLDRTIKIMEKAGRKLRR